MNFELRFQSPYSIDLLCVWSEPTQKFSEPNWKNPKPQLETVFAGSQVHNQNMKPALDKTRFWLLVNDREIPFVQKTCWQTCWECSRDSGKKIQNGSKKKEANNQVVIKIFETNKSII